MKKTLIAGLIVLMAVTIGAAEDKYGTRVIQVSATGKVMVVPDTAVINFGIKTEGDKAVTAQKKNYRQIDELINYLKESGLSEKKINLQSFNIRPVYDKNNKYILRYEAQANVRAKTTKTKKVAEIVDGAVEHGVNLVNNISFVVGDPEAAQQAALENAIANAKDKAWKIAKELDVGLGKVLMVSEGYQQPIYSNQMRSMGLSESSVSMPELPVGETEITARATVVYEID